MRRFFGGGGGWGRGGGRLQDIDDDHVDRFEPTPTRPPPVAPSPPQPSGCGEGPPPSQKESTDRSRARTGNEGGSSTSRARSIEPGSPGETSKKERRKKERKEKSPAVMNDDVHIKQVAAPSPEREGRKRRERHSSASSAGPSPGNQVARQLDAWEQGDATSGIPTPIQPQQELGASGWPGGSYQEVSAGGDLNWAFSQPGLRSPPQTLPPPERPQQQRQLQEQPPHQRQQPLPQQLGPQPPQPQQNWLQPSQPRQPLQTRKGLEEELHTEPVTQKLPQQLPQQQQQQQQQQPKQCVVVDDDVLSWALPKGLVPQNNRLEAALRAVFDPSRGGPYPVAARPKPNLPLGTSASRWMPPAAASVSWSKCPAFNPLPQPSSDDLDWALPRDRPLQRLSVDPVLSRPAAPDRHAFVGSHHRPDEAADDNGDRNQQKELDWSKENRDNLIQTLVREIKQDLKQELDSLKAVVHASAMAAAANNAAIPKWQSPPQGDDSYVSNRELGPDQGWPQDDVVVAKHSPSRSSSPAGPVRKPAGVLTPQRKESGGGDTTDTVRAIAAAAATAAAVAKPERASPGSPKKKLTAVQQRPSLSDDRVIWTLEPGEAEQYSDTFEGLAEWSEKGVLSIGGGSGRTLFEQSELPVGELSKIWQMSDRDGDGRLDLSELICAMALIARRRKGIVLPPMLPAELVRQSEAFVQTQQEDTPALGGLRDQGMNAKTNIPYKGSAVGMTSVLDDDGTDWSVQADEMARYRATFFEEADAGGSGYAGLREVKDILERSGLASHELAQIYTVSDLDRDGRLSISEFVCAMAMVARRLRGAPVPDDVPQELLTSLPPPGPSPLVDDYPMVVMPSASPFEHLGENSLDQDGNSVDWSMRADELARYRATFFEAADPAGTGYAGLREAKDLLERSGLDSNELAKIYMVSDMDRDGRLSLPEFICAMAMVARRLRGAPVPDEIPMELLASLPTSLSDDIPNVMLSSASASLAELLREHPLDQAGWSSLQKHCSLAWKPGDHGLPPPVPRRGWLPSTEELLAYDAIGEGLDSTGTGAVTAQDARHLLEQSGLPIADLSYIWELSDVDRDGRLTRAEFRCVMALVTARRAGAPLPELLP